MGWVIGSECLGRGGFREPKLATRLYRFVIRPDHAIRTISVEKSSFDLVARHSGVPVIVHPTAFMCEEQTVTVLLNAATLPF